MGLAVLCVPHGEMLASVARVGGVKLRQMRTGAYLQTLGGEASCDEQVLRLRAYTGSIGLRKANA